MRLFFGSCISSLEIRNPFKILWFFFRADRRVFKNLPEQFSLLLVYIRKYVGARCSIRTLKIEVSKITFKERTGKKKVSIPTWFSRFLGVLEWPKNSLKPKHQSTYYSFPAYFQKWREYSYQLFSFCLPVTKIMKREFVW